ncbi:hypothetical protein BH09MYX1_BH09MYX1_57890 [soil metagenome]
MNEDPPRLSKDSALGLMLDDARADTLDAETRARVLRAVEGAALTGAVGASLVKGGTLAFWKLGVAAICTVAIAGGGVYAWHAVGAPVAIAPMVTAPQVVTPTASAVATAVVAEATSEPLPVTSATSAPSMASSAAVAVKPIPRPSASQADALPTLTEGRMLLDAKAAAATDPARALALTTEHATSFPRSPLAAERESIAIDALARLGRCAEAHARATRFRADFAGSPHTGLVDRAEATCGK